MVQNAILHGSIGHPAFAPAISQRKHSVLRRNARKEQVAAAKLRSSGDGTSNFESNATWIVSLSTLLTAYPAAAALAVDAIKEPTQAASEAVTTAQPAIKSAAAAVSSAVNNPAVSRSAIDSAVNQIVSGVKAAGGAVKGGVDVATQGFGRVREAADVATPYVQKSVNEAIPYLKKGYSVAEEAARPVIRAAEPIVQNGLNEAEEFLRKNGLNTQSLFGEAKKASSKAEEAINLATPTVKSTATQLSASSPQTLAQYGAVLAGVYFLGPVVIRALFGGLRGFAGTLSPAAALDAAATDGNAIIVDIRPGNEKEYAGVPDIPKRDRLVELEYAVVADRRVRGALRNVNAIEKQMTILQIAALKKIKKSTKVILLDKNGGAAKDIAKGLSARGFKRVYVVAGGFNGWTNSRLQTRGSSSVSSVEILGPVFGTRSTTGSKNSKALPSGR